MSSERKGELYGVIMAFLESWFPIFTVFILTAMGALFAYVLTVAVTSLIFIVIISYQKTWSEFLIKEAYVDLLWVTFYITLLFLLIMTGLEYTTAGNMSVIITLQLFFSYLYFSVFGSENISKIQSIGAFLMGIGAIIILFPENFSLNKGDFLIFLGAIVAPLTARHQQKARAYVSATTILAFRNIVALPIVLLVALYIEKVPTLSDVVEVSGFILLNALLIFTLSKILFVEALMLISITKLMALISFMPVFTLILAYFILDEVPDLVQFMGMIPVILGSYLITKRVHNL